MKSRVSRGRRPARPVAHVLAGSRKLFGESLPELFLLTAVLAAVIGAAVSLHG